MSRDNRSRAELKGSLCAAAVLLACILLGWLLMTGCASLSRPATEEPHYLIPQGYPDDASLMWNRSIHY